MIRIMSGVAIAFLLCRVPSASGAELKPLPALVSAPDSNPQTPEKIELGKMLFFDRRLSGDGTMSCASCHDPEQGFTDGLALSLSYPTTRNWRNSPTLMNVAFQKFLFHDGRAPSLEEQALFPMMSAFEMNLNLDFLEEKLRTVPEYVDAFRKVFGDPDITRGRVAMAIASFERSLVSVSSPLDRYLKGDAGALSAEAAQGYVLFVGKADCVRCHHGAGLSDDRFHALNVPENREQEKDPRVTATRRFVAKVYRYADFRSLDEDPGRYLITKDAKDWKAFKTPTLREISRTAPYMHNGIMASLDEVIDFFVAGGGKGNAALKPLRLTSAEKHALKVFLEEAMSGERTPFLYPKVP